MHLKNFQLDLIDFIIGENDPRAVEKYLEFGLCVCDKTNNKAYGDAVVKCLDENKDTLEMFNTCHNQMEGNII